MVGVAHTDLVKPAIVGENGNVSVVGGGYDDGQLCMLIDMCLASRGPRTRHGDDE
jgi:hypothetical protein